MSLSLREVETVEVHDTDAIDNITVIKILQT